MLPTLYAITKPRPLWQVRYEDPAIRDSSGRAKRVRKHFSDEARARAYLDEITRKITTEGLAGLAFDAPLRADALLARQRLNAAGHHAVTLQQLATEYNERVRHSGTAVEPIGPVLRDFLDEKENVEGCSERTVVNLRNRLRRWLDDAKITTVGGITRTAVEELRLRPGVCAQSRRNDINVVSSFCTWLFDKGRIASHPLKGLRRPRVPQGKKQTFTPEQCRALLNAAQTYAGGKWLGTVAVMLFLGPRPSELAETRIYYGRHPVARLEGGKLRGQANRTVPLIPAAQAWLAAAGKPEQVVELNSKARMRLCQRAGLTWSADVTRHTFISNRLALLQDDAQVGREAGTSKEMIHRHYHSLKMPAEARQWAALRPGKLPLISKTNTESILV